MAASTGQARPAAGVGRSEGRRVAVVGGGMAGIAAAFYLRRAGHSPEVIEAEPVLGGRCAPATLGDHQITYGGKNIGQRYRCFREFTAAMGDQPYEYFGINSSRVENGKLQRFDSERKIRSFARFGMRSRKRDLLRMGSLMAAVKTNEERRYLGSRYSERLARNGDRLLSAHFAPEFLDLLRPLVVRPNGAEPDELYLGTFNANVGMILDSYDQLVHGIGPVLERFASEHDTLLGTRVESLLLDGGRVSGVRVTDAQGETEDRLYDAVMIATPAFWAADLVRPHRAALAAELERVRYFGGAVVVAEYARDIFSEEVRALVFDKTEPLSNAGVYGVNDRHMIRYTFSGRVARAWLAEGRDDDELIAAAEERLNRHVPVSAADRRGFVAQSWGHAYCGHLQDHPAFLRTVRRELEQVPGLGLAGDYLRGVSIEACFRSARDGVEALAGTWAAAR